MTVSPAAGAGRGERLSDGPGVVGLISLHGAGARPDEDEDPRRRWSLGFAVRLPYSAITGWPLRSVTRRLDWFPPEGGKKDA